MKIVGLDWAIKKSLVTYDGKEIKYYSRPEDIDADVIVLETGAPFGLIARLRGEIWLIDGKLVNKVRKERGLDKSDEVSAMLIYELRDEAKKLEARDKYEIEARYYYKQREYFLKLITALKNLQSSIEREYGEVDPLFNQILKKLEKKKEWHEKKLLQKCHMAYPWEVRALMKIKPLGEFTAHILPLFTRDIDRFPNFSKFIKYCGFADKKGDWMKSNKKVKALIWRAVDASVVKNRLQPYRELYDKYKEKKLKEGKTRGHADKLARRKVAQKILREVWRALRQAKKNKRTIWEVIEDQKA